jgi:hypothetical protein
MIPHIPRQRQQTGYKRGAFSDLVSYIEENKGQHLEHVRDPHFADLFEYAVQSQDKLTNVEKCLAVRVHGVCDLSTASAEMNAVAAKNHRCKDPAYHIILSWPEHEKPENETIFDAAEHAIRSLGLGQHQYFVAIHGNTDNRHCHIAVNRIHPTTFKSHHIEWAYEKLHHAARQSELKHGWTHDNGIYIVSEGIDGRKQIVFNRDHQPIEGQDAPIRDRRLLAPDWHDRESLENWLKGPLAKRLKQDLPQLDGWHALHSWLDVYSLQLKDTGGGGMRLIATSYETGEILELPTSRGLRQLKRADLEARWGDYQAPLPASKVILPATEHLTPTQLAQGANNVIGQHFDFGTTHDDILHLEEHRKRLVAKRRSGLHELPSSSVVSPGQDPELLLPDDVRDNLDHAQTGQDHNLRRSSDRGAASREIESKITTNRSRDPAQRELRKQERAAARADLRQRYAQYKKFVRLGDASHVTALRQIRKDRSAALKEINQQTRDAIREARSRKTTPDLATRLMAVAAAEEAAARRKAPIDNRYRNQAQELNATRLPPLGWREWLHEQANLGDQAALSALRGIVYKERRDAKNAGTLPPEEDLDIERAKRDLAYREDQHKKLLARLLEEEKKEIAIRAANAGRIRPYETDAILRRYVGLQWRVTGNGNVEYSDIQGSHVFTDKGSRVTFDRKIVTDDEIKLALFHARQKFGKTLTLTGEDPIFTARMARLADDMGLTILNPELQTVIEAHRQHKIDQPKVQTPILPVAPTTHQVPDIEHQNITPSPEQQPIPASSQSESPQVSTPNQSLPVLTSSVEPDHPVPMQQQPLEQEVVSAEIKQQQEPIPTLNEMLRTKVLAIDPHAKFVLPDSQDEKRHYVGPLAVTTDNGFAQHIGRNQYVLHSGTPPQIHADIEFDISYKQGMIQIVAKMQRGKQRE